MVVSLLGVLKSGAAYLPLDPDYPVERLTFMLTDSNAKRLITTKEIYERLLSETTENMRVGVSYKEADTTSYRVSSHQNADVNSYVGLSSVGFDDDRHRREAFANRDATHSRITALTEALLARNLSCLNAHLTNAINL